MTKTIGTFERQLCDIQGRLFELSVAKGLDSADFTEKFMHSATAEFLDLPYDRLQWSGEEYILENLLNETELKRSGAQYSRDVMFWIGYVYRHWHFERNESSAEIYAQAPAERMESCWLGFHSLDVSMAIDDLKEIYRQVRQTY